MILESAKRKVDFLEFDQRQRIDVALYNQCNGHYLQLKIKSRLGDGQRSAPWLVQRIIVQLLTEENSL